jgi:DNA-binding NarL/FixJ family response regulator
MMRTAKRSLLGCGIGKAAILGLTRILSTGPDEKTLRSLGLSHSWMQFRSLEERDRQIALGLAAGHSAKHLGAQHSVTDKTIDNRKARILEKLGLKNTNELAILLSRLQDRGYADFGL